jgi:hypothetical protein
MGQVSDAFTSQNAYRVGMWPAKFPPVDVADPARVLVGAEGEPESAAAAQLRSNGPAAPKALQTTDRQVSRSRDTYRSHPKAQFVIAASLADRPNTNAALPSAGLDWGFKPELVEALDQRELLSMTTPHLTGGSKCVWPHRAARTRLDDRWARLGWSAAFADLPSV